MHLPHLPSCARRLVAALFLSACLALPAAAQQPLGPGLPQPRLLVVSPAGGQAGTAVEVTVTGNDLEQPQKLLFNHPGMKAEPVADSTKPAKPPQGGQPALMTAKFKVTIPPDVPVGHYDVRFVSKDGVSNPRVFVVGDLPETTEKEPNNDVDQAQEVPLNSTVHGAITAPTDVDYFRFAAKKGQRVVVSCLASSIDSKLQAALEVYDKAGALLAANRNYHDGDALLDVTPADDGDLFVRINSFAYLQGTAEHFYRLTVSTAPWIDAVFPPVVEPGKATKVTVYGRNLPDGKPDPDAVVDGRVLETMTVTVNAPGDAAALQRLAYRGHVAPLAGAMDGFEYRVRNKAGTSNPFLLTFAQAPVVTDNGDNDTPEKAQAVPVPCEIAGRIEKKRDRDWYSFTAKKGDVLSIELYGDRLGSPLDLYAVLKSTGPKGSTIVELDDSTEQVPNQFYTRGDDPPRYQFKVPADGTYLLMVSSREADVEAGPRHLYRVRIAPEKPDFRVVLMPSSATTPDACVVRRGATQFFTAFVTRLDGFNDEITLTADGLPQGVTCPPQTIPAGQKQGILVLTAAEGAPLWAGDIHVKATATIDDKKVEREARAATITWPLPQNQQGPTISRLDGSLVLAVTEQGPFALTTTMTTATAKPGDKLTVPLKLARNWADFKAPVQVTVLGLPGGNQPPQPTLTIAADKTEGNVVVDVRPNLPPGVYTIVFRGQAQFQYSKDPMGKQKQNVTVLLPSPPLTLTVVKK
ncbi:MAG TPA: PPC domain-containing protein [Gemmataceae bacterium]|nr:PPC domain-containing protein [Gemmataceae bacterium]